MTQATLNRVKVHKPNVGIFSQRLHKNMTRLWRNATKAFLEAVIEGDLIRVETGMSKASLLPLARAVQMLTVVRATIDPKVASRRGYTSINGVYNPNGERSVDSGIKLGEKAYTLNFGLQDRPIFNFEFRIVVYQHLLYENGLVHGYPPQDSLVKGQAAFRQYIEDNKQQYVPRLAEWIEVR